ncbi:hypothetical protein [Lichenicoccus sp.]|uniref:hypothetical protein n=1 Tax=Lichenicoccus sp. TaxID=2781899 RepID=UPI003D0C5A53
MMASLDEIALVRLAAQRTESHLGWLNGAMTLLYISMGNVKPPVHEEVDTWVRIIEWMSDVVADLERNLQRSLQHDELEAMEKRVKQ